MALAVYKPEYKDLWFKQQMMADEETMSYNRAWGGTIPFPENRWKEWFDRWLDHPGQERYYRYLVDDAGDFVGEIAYHYDRETDRNLADVVIFSKYRGRGYGRQGLKLLCAQAKENGISVLYDEIALDNPAIRLFQQQGFTEETRTDRTILLRKKL